jgi:Uma2 family endonuclease
MSTAALVSMEEYLHTAWSPDREFVDGVIVERNVGDRLHSLVQTLICLALHRRRAGILAVVELRMRTIAGKCRIPDVLVARESFTSDILETAPFLCVEVLSPDDRVAEVLEKLDEYRQIGVPHIWLVDPRRQKAYVYDGNLVEATAGRLSTSDPEIFVTFDEIFPQS